MEKTDFELRNIYENNNFVLLDFNNLKQFVIKYVYFITFHISRAQNYFAVSLN